MIRIDEYKSHITIPFEFSDSDEKIKQNFENPHIQFILLNKFYTEKRGIYDQEDDDYTLTGIEG